MSIHIVTTNADSGDGSLRAALAAASTGDSIVFDASLAGSTILLASALVPAVAVNIEGLTTDDDEQEPAVAVDGGGRVRVFAVSAAVSLTLKNLTLQNAKSTSPGGAIQLARATASVSAENVFFLNNVARQGSAVYGCGNFTNCEFVGNSTTGIAGVDSNASGGAVCDPYATASSFVNCYFKSNTSAGSGGAYYAPVSTLSEFDGCAFDNNDAAAGGAVAASASFDTCRFLRNTATDAASSAISARSSVSIFEGVELLNDQRVATTESSVVTLHGHVKLPALALANGSSLVFAADGASDAAVGIAEITVEGSVSSSGSGLVALPDGFDSSVLSLPSTVTASTYGARAKDFFARSAGDSGVLTWTTREPLPVLLQQKTASGWTTLSTTASSPFEVDVATRTRFRIWDGVDFLEADVVVISDHAWTVYAAAVAVDLSSAFKITTYFLMMSAYYNRGETPILFARIEDSRTSQPLAPDAITSASYSLFKTTYAWGAETRNPVEGHQDVAIPLSAFSADLVTDDPRWTQDSRGYNFKFEPDATSIPLFATGGSYVLIVTINLASGNPAPLVYNISAS